MPNTCSALQEHFAWERVLWVSGGKACRESPLCLAAVNIYVTPNDTELLSGLLSKKT